MLIIIALSFNNIRNEYEKYEIQKEISNKKYDLF